MDHRAISVFAFTAFIAFFSTTKGQSYEVKTIVQWPASPDHVFFDCDRDRNDGNPVIYCTDHKHHVIRVVDLETNNISVLAGSPGNASHADGLLSEARFKQPTSLCLSPCDSRLYIVDLGNFVIRSIDFQSGHVSTVAGVPGKPGVKDGLGPSALFSEPWSIICMNDGSIIVSEPGVPSLRQIAGPKSCTSPPPGPGPLPPKPQPIPGPGPDAPSDTNAGHQFNWIAMVAAGAGAGALLTVLGTRLASSYIDRKVDQYRHRHLGQPWIRPADVEDGGSSEARRRLLPPPSPVCILPQPPPNTPPYDTHSPSVHQPQSSHISPVPRTLALPTADLLKTELSSSPSSLAAIRTAISASVATSLPDQFDLVTAHPTGSLQHPTPLPSNRAAGVASSAAAQMSALLGAEGRPFTIWNTEETAATGADGFQASHDLNMAQSDVVRRYVEGNPGTQVAGEVGGCEQRSLGAGMDMMADSVQQRVQEAAAGVSRQSSSHQWDVDQMQDLNPFRGK